MSTTTDTAFSESAAREPTPAAAAERGDTADRVLTELDRLPAKQQEVLRLRFQGELSYREIAGVTGLSADHVGVLIHQGVKTLRLRLRRELSPEASG